jgi:hypothetical protein
MLPSQAHANKMLLVNRQRKSNGLGTLYTLYQTILCIDFAFVFLHSLALK